MDGSAFPLPLPFPRHQTDHEMGIIDASTRSFLGRSQRVLNDDGISAEKLGTGNNHQLKSSITLFAQPIG